MVRSLMLLVGVIAVGVPAPAHAATQLEKDLRSMKKVAVPEADKFGAKPKSLCVCLADGVPGAADEAGIVTYEAVPGGIAGGSRDAIVVRCQVMEYDQTSGARVLSNPCDDWAPLQ